MTTRSPGTTHCTHGMSKLMIQQPTSLSCSAVFAGIVIALASACAHTAREAERRRREGECGGAALTTALLVEVVDLNLHRLADVLKDARTAAKESHAATALIVPRGPNLSLGDGARDTVPGVAAVAEVVWVAS